MTNSLRTPPISPRRRFSSDMATLVGQHTIPTLSMTTPMPHPKPPMAAVVIPTPNPLLRSSHTSTRTSTKPTPGRKTQVCGTSKDKPKARPLSPAPATMPLPRRPRTINSISPTHRVPTTGAEGAVKAKQVLVPVTPTIVDLRDGGVMALRAAQCSQLDRSISYEDMSFFANVIPASEMRRDTPSATTRRARNPSIHEQLSQPAPCRMPLFVATMDSTLTEILRDSWGLATVTPRCRHVRAEGSASPPLHQSANSLLPPEDLLLPLP